MSDYRNDLLQAIQEALITILPPETTEMAARKITCVLNDYEVAKRPTELVVYDDENARILKRYCACLMVDGKSPRTIKGYSRCVKVFLDTIGKPIKEIGVYDIRFYLATEKERGISDRSLENTRSYLSSFFTWLTGENLLTVNPFLNIKPIKYADKERMPFSPVELDALRHNCKTLKERAIIEILATSGVRVSELCGINITDINFIDLSVHIKHGKGGKERITYINDVARVHIQKYLESRTDNQLCLILNNKRGTMCPGGIRKILHTIGNRAHVDNVHPHRFRRTFATNLASRGMPVQEIQKLLGHSNIGTTMEYVCISDSQVKTSYKQHIA